MDQLIVTYSEQFLFTYLVTRRQMQQQVRACVCSEATRETCHVVTPALIVSGQWSLSGQAKWSLTHSLTRPLDDALKPVTHSATRRLSRRPSTANKYVCGHVGDVTRRRSRRAALSSAQRRSGAAARAPRSVRRGNHVN